MKEYKHFTVEQREGVTILSFVDPKILDEVLIFDAGIELLSFANELHRGGILINWRNVWFMSTAFHSKIFAFARKMREAEIPLVMTDIDPRICKALDETKLSVLFKVEETLGEGEAYLHSLHAHAR